MIYKIKKVKYLREISFLVVIASLLFFNFTPSYAQYYASGGYFTNNNSSSDSGQASVSTNGSTNITSESALLSGLVNGNYAYNNYNFSTWFEYGFTPSLGYYTNRNLVSSGYSFSYVLTRLRENTVYYFRAAAQTPQGVIYGGISAFRTSPLTTITPVNNLNETIKPAYVPTTSPTSVRPSTTSTTVKKTPAVSTGSEVKVEKPTTNTNTASFLPITILGWILLIILILILILTIKHVHLKFTGNKHG